MKWIDDFDPDEFMPAPDYGPSIGESRDEEENDEFLAAPNYADHSEAELPADHSDSEELDEGWRPEQGFPDGCRAVRLWADGEGHLSRVRVSLNWREKTAKTGLDRAFLFALAEMNAYFHPGGFPVPYPEPEPAVPHEGRFGWHSLERVNRELAEIDAQIAALGPDEPRTRWVGVAAQGDEHKGAVKVTLNVHGFAVAVNFDPQWVELPVTSRDIARAVTAAHRRARSKFSPPKVEFGRRELLLARKRHVVASMMATLSHGIEL